MRPPPVLSAPTCPQEVENPGPQKDASSLGVERRCCCVHDKSTLYGHDIHILWTHFFGKNIAGAADALSHTEQPAMEGSRCGGVAPPEGNPPRCSRPLPGARDLGATGGRCTQPLAAQRASGAERGGLFTAINRPILLACAVLQDLCEPRYQLPDPAVRDPSFVGHFVPSPELRRLRTPGCAPRFAIPHRATRGAVVGLDLR